MLPVAGSECRVQLSSTTVTASLCEAMAILSHPQGAHPVDVTVRCACTEAGGVEYSMGLPMDAGSMMLADGTGPTDACNGACFLALRAA
jgi:hypothetical protein